MKENKDEFNESYEKHKKVLYQFMNFKKNKTYIYNRSMCIHPKTELKKCNYKYLPKELTFNFFKFPRSSSCKKDIINFIKSVGIYQLFILQFSVTIAEGNSGGVSQKSTLEQFPETVINKAKEFWGIITKYLCEICTIIGIHNKGAICKDSFVAIPVVVFFFLFVFGIICLICCKCCCKKSCCKKKESEESDVDCNQFIMGPDGQMYSQMYQGQMVQPQMIPAGMMYPQMYPGQMYYPQMLQQGMQQPEMQYMEIQQPEMQYMEMQQ